MPHLGYFSAGKHKQAGQQGEFIFLRPAESNACRTRGDYFNKVAARGCMGAACNSAPPRPHQWSTNRKSEEFHTLSLYFLPPRARSTLRSIFVFHSLRTPVIGYSYLLEEDISAKQSSLSIPWFNLWALFDLNNLLPTNTTICYYLQRAVSARHVLRYFCF